MVAKNEKNANFAFVVIEDDAKLDKAIRSIASRGATLDKDMHIVACSVLNKLINTGDAPLADRRIDGLIKDMPKASKVNALRAWFEHYGPITFEKGKAKYVRKVNIADSLPEAFKTPFWKFKSTEGVAYKPLGETLTYAQTIIQKLKTDAEKTGADHTALLALLAGYVESSKSASPKPVEPAQTASPLTGEAKELLA